MRTIFLSLSLLIAFGTKSRPYLSIINNYYDKTLFISKLEKLIEVLGIIMVIIINNKFSGLQVFLKNLEISGLKKK